MTNVKDVLVEQDIYKFIMNIKSENLRSSILNECKVIKYEAEYTIPWQKGQWFGILEALGVNKRECEVNFLNSLVENGYRYINMSLEEISYDLDIQTRTLQRVVRKFEDLGLIRREKEKRNIFTVSKEKIECYMSH